MHEAGKKKRKRTSASASASAQDDSDGSIVSCSDDEGSSNAQKRQEAGLGKPTYERLHTLNSAASDRVKAAANSKPDKVQKGTACIFATSSTRTSGFRDVSGALYCGNELNFALVTDKWHSSGGPHMFDSGEQLRPLEEDASRAGCRGHLLAFTKDSKAESTPSLSFWLSMEHYYFRQAMCVQEGTEKVLFQPPRCYKQAVLNYLLHLVYAVDAPAPDASVYDDGHCRYFEEVQGTGSGGDDWSGVTLAAFNSFLAHPSRSHSRGYTAAPTSTAEACDRALFLAAFLEPDLFGEYIDTNSAKRQDWYAQEAIRYTFRTDVHTFEMGLQLPELRLGSGSTGFGLARARGSGRTVYSLTSEHLGTDDVPALAFPSPTSSSTSAGSSSAPGPDLSYRAHWLAGPRDTSHDRCYERNAEVRARRV